MLTASIGRFPNRMRRALSLQGFRDSSRVTALDSNVSLSSLATKSMATRSKGHLAVGLTGLGAARVVILPDLLVE